MTLQELGERMRRGPFWGVLQLLQKLGLGHFLRTLVLRNPQQPNEWTVITDDDVQTVGEILLNGGKQQPLKIPEFVVTQGLESAKGTFLFGTALESLSRRELLALAALGWNDRTALQMSMARHSVDKR